MAVIVILDLEKSNVTCNRLKKSFITEKITPNL